MAELLFEVWASPTSIECARVSPQADRLREQEPEMAFEGSFYASSHEDSMRQHYDRQGWGTYKPIPGLSEIPFSDAERAEQDAYLLERKTTAKPLAERD